jgi:hypothetical protein
MDMRPLDALKRANRNESEQDYTNIVAVLNGNWRVIECRAALQWILQSRDTRPGLENGVWRGRSYCRTKRALLRVCAVHAGDINPAASDVLAALPDWIEPQSSRGNLA